MTYQLTGANVAKDSRIHVAKHAKFARCTSSANYPGPTAESCASTLSAHAHCGDPSQFLKVVSKKMFTNFVPLAKSLFVFFCHSTHTGRPET